MNESDLSPTASTAVRPRVDAGIVLIVLVGLLVALQVAWVLWSGADPAAATAPVSTAAETSSTD